MPLRRIMLLSLLVAFALGLFAPVAALASGSSSAGDQQYVDPLSGNSGNGGGSSSSSGSDSGSSGSGSSGSSSSGSSSSGAVSSSTGSTGTVSSSSSSSTSGTSAGTTSTGKLPFTGFDAPVAVAVGVVLIGAGFVLRRRILRA